MENKLGNGFQLVFNLINQRARSIMEKASAAGYGIIARMPLQFGLLTGKFTRQTNFGPDDHRSFRLTPPILQHTLSVLEEKVWPIASKTEMSKAALALSFILSYPSVSTVIPGIRTEEHVVQNTSGLQALDPSDLQLLQSMSASDWIPVLEEMEKQG
jgi:aryl-alcohol dehydrogenase-like predicted oxidoreductase